MSFKKECEQMGWWFRSKPEGVPITHTLMDGSGVLVVPLQQRARFYEICMQCLSKREKLFMVEQTKSSDRFRMFLDVDYLTTEDQGAVTDETIKRWAMHLYEAFPSLGPVLVSTCTRKQDRNFKNGIHLSWPQVTVTYGSAMNIYKRVMMEMKNFDDSVQWDSVLDKSVFKTGLRTIWAWKIKRENKEMVVPYVPRFEVNKDGLTEISQSKPTASMLERFSILPHGNEPNHFAGDDTIISGASVDDEFVTWIKQVYPKHNISKVEKVIPKKTHWVITTTCKYCEFIGKEHQSNHIWFLVDKESQTIMSKCHDEDHKGLSGRKMMVHPKIIKYLQKLNKV